MIVKTEAVVLRGMKYRETSKILTLYTRQYGKLSAIAKGCRGPKSRFGSSLEPMSVVTVVLYKKEDRDLQLLTQCDVVRPLRRLSEDMDRLYAAMTVVALLERATHPEEKNERLFATTVSSLDAINDATVNPVNVLYKFEVSLLDILGFKPNFHTCSSCRKEMDGGTSVGLHLAMGGVLCASCSKDWAGDGTVSGQGLLVLQHLQDSDGMNEIARFSILPHVRNEVHEALRRYLQCHIEGLQGLKTEDVFSAIL